MKRNARRGARAGLLLASAIGIACGAEDAGGGIAVSGHVEATEVRVAAEVGGRLEEVAVREGDSVETGQLLARIDATDTRLARQAAEAERDQARAQLRLLLAGAREEELAEARAVLAAAEAERDGARRERERMQGLLDSGSGTERARDAAVTRHDAAVSAAEAARERLRRLEAGARVEEVAAARARVAAAEARLALLAEQLADTELHSPAAGIVTERLAEPGELVTRGSGVVVLTRLADAWLNVYVGEPDLGRLRLGQPAEVVTDGGERREGRIRHIASRAEFTPRNVQTREERVKLVFRVEIALDNADGLFKPGMPAEARLAVPGAGE